MPMTRTLPRDHAARRNGTAVRPRRASLLRSFTVGALALAATIAPAPGNADAHRSPAPIDCSAEDSRGFSWSECPNGHRGVILTSAPKRCQWDGEWSRKCFTVVDACEYRTLRRSGDIDRKRTRSLKGDGFALAHGCER